MTSRVEDIKRTAASIARAKCVWAKSHDGVTCIEATAKGAFWCLECNRAFEAAKVIPHE